MANIIAFLECYLYVIMTAHYFLVYFLGTFMFLLFFQLVYII